MLAETPPFYAESGGQDADSGTITAPGTELEVLDVQSPVPGLIVHKVQVNAGGEVHLGQQVTAAVDPLHRMGACQAHSATHVIHAVLRRTVGPDAVQAGSYNKPGYLRFDFQSPHGSARISVRRSRACPTRRSPPTCRSPRPSWGWMRPRRWVRWRCSGEKYPERVRVIEMGGGVLPRAVRRNPRPALLPDRDAGAAGGSPPSVRAYAGSRRWSPPMRSSTSRPNGPW